ncbi:MAG: hypothetical protein R3C24_08395 [Cyanobacteriota/Melainabacteria group bacterium]
MLGIMVENISFANAFGSLSVMNPYRQRTVFVIVLNAAQEVGKPIVSPSP